MKMKLDRRYLFWAFWALAGVAVLLIYFRYETNSDFIGLVESRTHVLGVREEGRIAVIHVVQGQNVAAGQVLLELDMSDLDAEEALLRAELSRREAQLNADRIRFGLEFDKLLTQREADALNIYLKHTDLVEKKAELDSVKQEIARLQSAQDAGLGRSRDLSDLIIRRDTLERVIAAQKPILKSKGAGSGDDGRDKVAEREEVVRSMLGENHEKMNEIRVNLQIVQARRANRTIISPTDGRVVNLVNMAGDTVDNFVPVINIEETAINYVDAYVPETSGQLPQIGQRVNLYPHRQMAQNATGVIVAVDPGYQAIPLRLSFRGNLYWARKFRIQVDRPHALMPGEAVRVEMQDSMIGVTDAIANAIDHQKAPGTRQPDAAPASGDVPMVETSGSTVTLDASALQKIRYAPASGFEGSFEPSGLIWLADIERYLIVSDDTGAGKARHSPWLFLMDRFGAVDPKPVVLQGVAELNDLEAITASPDGGIYLVSSNNANRKGKRKPVRQQILKVAREGRDFRVVASAALFDAVMQLEPEQVAALGIVKDGSGLDVLNIEGASWDLAGSEPAMLIGLKQPVGPEGSIIWRLKNPDLFLASGKLVPGQLSVFAKVDLGRVRERPASISDLLVTADGIYVLSTVPDAPDPDQIGRLLRLLPVQGGYVASALFEYRGLKPEGLCLTEGDSFTVVMDTGDAPALFHTSRWSR